IAVLPNEPMAAAARQAFAGGIKLDLQTGNLAAALARSTLALACTGTVTMECAFFEVPTVAFYRTSWFTYQVAKRLIQVPYLAMPNILAGEELFPEFIQQQ